MVSRLARHHARADLGELAAVPQAYHATVVVKLSVEDAGAGVLDDVELEAPDDLADQSHSGDEDL